MADRPDAYVRKDPGDIIRSGDWNELQIRAREEIQKHTHTGEADGTQIPRKGIEPKAIDGTLIDPTADVTVNSLTANKLTVQGSVILDDVKNLLTKVDTLQSTKVDRTGDTIEGNLTVKGKLTAGNISIGLDEGGSGNKSISFARDSGDEANAGKISYKGFGANALSIVGAGSSGSRKIKLWDNVEISGELSVTTTLNTKSLKINGNDVTTSLNNKLETSGGTITGNLNISGSLAVSNRITDKTGQVMPVGTILPYMGTTAPQGWLICDGSAIPATYSDLISLIGKNTPDLRGRTLIGASSTFKLTDTGGAYQHTLTVDEMPGHDHEFPGDDQLKNYAANISSTAKTIAYDASSTLGGSGYIYLTSKIGGSKAHNNMQPYYVINYIIKC